MKSLTAGCPRNSFTLTEGLVTTTSKYAPTFEHWNRWDTCKFKIKNAIRHAYWGTLKRKEQHFRRGYQQSIIQKINGYFKTGWQLFGQGPVPWCEFNWSGSWVNTLFTWTDRTDPSNSSYHYRIGCTDHEGEFGIYCHSTDEVFQLGDSNGADEDIFLMIAAASVGLIVDRDNWTSDRMMVIKERIAATEGLLEIKAEAKEMNFTEESKQAVAGFLQKLSSEEFKNGNISANEATALNCVALSILIGFSDEGLKAFASADPAKTFDIFPLSLTELVSTWWNDSRITDAFPFLIELRKAVNGDVQLFESGIDWSYVLNAYIEAAKQFIEA